MATKKSRVSAMTNMETAPSSPEGDKTYKIGNLSLVIKDEGRLRELVDGPVDKPVHSVIGFLTPEGCRPMTESNLEIHRPKEGSECMIGANMTIHPANLSSDLEPSSVELWDERLLEALRYRIPDVMGPEFMPHDNRAIYSLNQTTGTIVRISCQSCIDGLTIDIQNVNAEELKKYAKKLPEIKEPNDNYESLKAVAGAWAITQSEIFDQLSEEDYIDEMEPILLIEMPEGAEYNIMSNTVSEASAQNTKTIEIYRGEEVQDPRKSVLSQYVLDGIEVTAPVMEVEVESKRTFDELGGLFQQKRDLAVWAELLKNPELAHEWGISRMPHMILHGPSGTGKSSLVEAFAAEAGALTYTIDSSIIDKWVGSSAKNWDESIEEAIAKTDGPLVIHLDKFETLAGSSGNRNQERLDVTARISQTLEALRNRPNVVIIATTGSDMADLAPDIIKSSHIQTMPIPMPNEAERADIWMVQLMDRFKPDWSSDLRNLTNDTNLGDVSSAESSEAIELSMIDFMELSRRTDGFSGGDIHKVLERAAFDRLRKKITGGQPMQPINQQDLLKAIGNYQQP